MSLLFVATQVIFVALIAVALWTVVYVTRSRRRSDRFSGRYAGTGDRRQNKRPYEEFGLKGADRRTGPEDRRQ